MIDRKFAFTTDIFQKLQFHIVPLKTWHVLDCENKTYKLKRSITFMKLNDMAPYLSCLICVATHSCYSVCSACDGVISGVRRIGTSFDDCKSDWLCLWMPFWIFNRPQSILGLHLLVFLILIIILGIFVVPRVFLSATSRKVRNLEFKYFLKNEQECIIRSKNSRQSQEFSHLIIRNCQFFERLQNLWYRSTVSFLH